MKSSASADRFFPKGAGDCDRGSIPLWPAFNLKIGATGLGEGPVFFGRICAVELLDDS